jgi:hypothetical protein
MSYYSSRLWYDESMQADTTMIEAMIEQVKPASNIIFIFPLPLSYLLLDHSENHQNVGSVPLPN